MVGVKNRIEETSPRVVTFNVTLSYLGKVSSLLYAEYGSNSPYLTGKLICAPHNLQSKSRRSGARLLSGAYLRVLVSITMLCVNLPRGLENLGTQCRTLSVRELLQLRILERSCFSGRV